MAREPVVARGRRIDRTTRKSENCHLKATIELPDDVFQQAQNQATEQGLELDQFLSDGLTKLIRASQSPVPPTGRRRVEFPIIKAKPGASVITKEMVDFSEEQILKEEAEHHGKFMRR